MAVDDLTVCLPYSPSTPPLRALAPTNKYIHKGRAAQLWNNLNIWQKQKGQLNYVVFHYMNILSSKNAQWATDIRWINLIYNVEPKIICVCIYVVIYIHIKFKDMQRHYKSGTWWIWGSNNYSLFQSIRRNIFHIFFYRDWCYTILYLVSACIMLSTF